MGQLSEKHKPRSALWCGMYRTAMLNTVFNHGGPMLTKLTVCQALCAVFVLLWRYALSDVPRPMFPYWTMITNVRWHTFILCACFIFSGLHASSYTPDTSFIPASPSFFWPLLGLLGLFAIAYGFSRHKHAISWTKIMKLMLAHGLMTGLFLKASWARSVFAGIDHALHALANAVQQGTSLVFGYLGSPSTPFMLQPAADGTNGSTFVLAFQSLPMMVVISALCMVAFHWRLLPLFIKSMAWVGQGFCHIGGVLATCMAGQVILDQVSATLLIKPYLQRLTRNEWLSTMTAGMATSSAGAFALYALLLRPLLGGDAVLHVVAAAIVNIPAALLVCEILIPERQKLTQGDYAAPHAFANTMQAIAYGTEEGWRVMWHVVAMLMVSMALIFLVNGAFEGLTGWLIGQPWSLSAVAGTLLSPLMKFIGIQAASGETLTAATWLAQKILFNEVVTLSEIAHAPAHSVSPRTVAILTYSICNFANFTSIGLQMLAFTSIEPTRKKRIAKHATQAMLCALWAGLWSSTVVSLWL